MACPSSSRSTAATHTTRNSLTTLWRTVWFREAGAPTSSGRLQQVEHEALLTLLANQAGVHTQQVVSVGGTAEDDVFLVLRTNGTALAAAPDRWSPVVVDAGRATLSRCTTRASRTAGRRPTSRRRRQPGRAHRLPGAAVTTAPDRLSTDVAQALVATVLGVGIDVALDAARGRARKRTTRPRIAFRADGGADSGSTRVGPGCGPRPRRDPRPAPRASPGSSRRHSNSSAGSHGARSSGRAVGARVPRARVRQWQGSISTSSANSSERDVGVGRARVLCLPASTLDPGRLDPRRGTATAPAKARVHAATRDVVHRSRTPEHRGPRRGEHPLLPTARTSGRVHGRDRRARRRVRTRRAGDAARFAAAPHADVAAAPPRFAHDRGSRPPARNHHRDRSRGHRCHVRDAALATSGPDESRELRPRRSSTRRAVCNRRDGFRCCVGGNLATELLWAASIGLFALAFGYRIGIAELLVINLSVALLSGVIPIPGGIGVVEGGLTFGLVHAGMPEETTFAAVILYRLEHDVHPTALGLFRDAVAGAEPVPLSSRGIGPARSAGAGDDDRARRISHYVVGHRPEQRALDPARPREPMTSARADTSVASAHSAGPGSPRTTRISAASIPSAAAACFRYHSPFGLEHGIAFGELLGDMTPPKCPPPVTSDSSLASMTVTTSGRPAARTSSKPAATASVARSEPSTHNTITPGSLDPVLLAGLTSRFLSAPGRPGSLPAASANSKLGP